MFTFVFLAGFVTWSNIHVIFAQKIGPCILPPYPKNGNYTILGNSSAVPGETLESYVIIVRCETGYQLVGDAKYSCLQGWKSDYQPQCIPDCQWKSSTTISCGAQETCYLQQFTVSGSSRAPLRQSADDNISECGKVGPNYLAIVAGGKPALLYEVPWHCGIYSKNFMPFMQICGGSLISRTVVISAAHCFWDDVLKQRPAKDYAVGLGKIYRPWSDPNDEYAQKADVQEIKIPPRFQGSTANFQEDLAVVILATSVTYTKAVRPVCLDFDYWFDSSQLKRGALGKVAGWGLTSADGRAAPVLQTAWAPYIPIEDCVSGAAPSFRAHISGDKICAGYSNGTAVCKGDSGGGLSFPTSTPSGERFYLRGVVSAAPQSDRLCSVFQWATFTHIIKHQHFIEDIIMVPTKK